MNSILYQIYMYNCLYLHSNTMHNPLTTPIFQICESCHQMQTYHFYSFWFGKNGLSEQCILFIWSIWVSITSTHYIYIYIYIHLLIKVIQIKYPGNAENQTVRRLQSFPIIKQIMQSQSNRQWTLNHRLDI